MMVLEIEGLSLLVMVFSGFSAFISNQKHLLNALLGLEFIMLNVFGVMSVYMASVGLDGVFVMFFLVMVACEGTLGFSLLVSFVRSHGNDYFSSFGILVC